MRRTTWILIFSPVFSFQMIVGVSGEQLPVDLSTYYNRDAWTPGAGEGIDDEGRRLDSATLPESFVDGQPNLSDDGTVQFLFGPTTVEGPDCIRMTGQTIDLPDGNYAALHLALLAEGGFANPTKKITLNYADGTTAPVDLRPLGGWMNSPLQFQDTRVVYRDTSNMETFISFNTNGVDDEEFIWEQSGGGLAGSSRFFDANSYIVYWLDLPDELTEATIGVDVGNNFVVSAGADPDALEEVLNSMEMFGEDHHALGNRAIYTIDAIPYLENNPTNEVFVKFEDGSKGDGWGPFITSISAYTGEVMEYEDNIPPAVDLSAATVYAQFHVFDDEENLYLFDHASSGPTDRRHRFADGAGYIIYRFDLPDTVNDAKITMDLANNFVVSVASNLGEVVHLSFRVGTPDEDLYLVDEQGSVVAGGEFRFNDATGYTLYELDLPDDLDSAIMGIELGNNFVVDLTPEGGSPVEILNSMDIYGVDVHDMSNRKVYEVELEPFLANNPSNRLEIEIRDGSTGDGWGGAIWGIKVFSRTEEGGFIEVLNSEEMFGVDDHGEHNKGYYTVDLSPVLADNPTKEVYVKLEDASTFDGWGPGVFWVAVYSGPIRFTGDTRIFQELKRDDGLPDGFGVNLAHRTIPLDNTRVLDSVTLPSIDEEQDPLAFLFAATLDTAPASVGQWFIR